MASTGGTGTTRPRRRTRRPLTIDWHTHVIVPEVFALTRDHSVIFGFRKAAAGASANRGARHGMVWQADAEKRLAAVDRMGVDIQVLSASLVHQCSHWAPARTGLKIDRMLNDRIAELVASRPDRFVGLATVPLQSVPLALRELERAVTRLGLRGVNISSNVDGRKDLDHDSLRPFWARVEELDVPVYIHPAGARGERFQRFFLWNSVGQPIEEAMAQCALIHGGVLDRFPRLKVVIAHGGGFVPYYTGRLDRNYANRPDIRGSLGAPPSRYLKRLYFDTCIYDPETYRFLVRKVGPGRLVMGSDYPVGEADPVAFVKKDRSLSSRARDGILGGTAAKLLKLT